MVWIGLAATRRMRVVVCAAALSGVACAADASELSDLRAQVRAIARQNQALERRIERVVQARRREQGAAGEPASPLGRAAEVSVAGTSGQGLAARGGSAQGPDVPASDTRTSPAQGSFVAGRSPLPPGGDAASANATSSGNSGSTTGVPTVQEQRAASSAPASAAIGGTPPIPATSALTFLGVTLYGAVDLGVAYQTHGVPLSATYGPGLEYLISKNSNRSLVSLAPNALSYSNVGLQGREPLLPGLSAVFNLQTSFLPSSGQLSNGPASLVQNNGVALGRQSAYGDSNRAGEALNAAAYAGLSSPRFGTITFGRQTALTSDGVVAYDPLFAANAFSVIGYQSLTAGMGNSEDARLDSSLKYLVNVGPVHAGALAQLNGANGRSVNADNSGGRGATEFDIGADYAGLDVDAIYSRLYDAIAAAPLSAAQQATAPPGSLAATVSDNRTLMLLAKYRVGPLQLFAGYENILYENPRDPLGAGSTTVGGIALGIINNAAYTNARLFQVGWAGARYAATRRLSLGIAYYRQHQGSYSGNGCGNASLASCRGDLDAGSVLVDYRVSPRFDLYAGAMLSTISGGLANGYLFNTTIDPTIGARFAF